MATLTLKRADTCHDCGRTLAQGTRARWYPKIGALCATRCTAAVHVDDVTRELARSLRYHTCAPGDRATCLRCEANDAECAGRTKACAKCGTVGYVEPGAVLCADCARGVFASFAVPASVQRRADEFAAGVELARATLAAVLS